MKVPRWWVLPTVLLVIVALVTILGPALVGTDRTTEYLKRTMSEATGAEVTLGKIQMRFWPRLHFTVGPGTISGSTAYPVLDKAAWQRVDLDLALGPLLRGDLEVDHIDIQGLNVAAHTAQHHVVLLDARCRGQGLHWPLGAGAIADTPPPMPGVPFQLTGGTLAVEGLEFRDIRSRGVADLELLRLDSFQATLAAGSVSGSGTVFWAQGDDLPVWVNARADNVPAAALFASAAPQLASRWEGNVNAEVSGRCVFQGGDVVADSLDIEGRITGQAGVIHAGDWLTDIAPYLGARQDLKDIRYTDLDHPFAVRNGRYQVQVKLEGPDTAWVGAGWVGMDGTLDVGLLVTLPENFTPDLGAWSSLASSLADKDGRITLALTITGKTVHPTVALDLQQTLAGSEGKASSALGKGLGGLLDKLKVR